MSTLSIRGTKASERLAGAGISLIVVVGLIHLIDAPGDLQEAPYQGLLFLANFFGSLTAAIGIYRGRTWGWSLGFLVAGGAFVGYVISRTVGLPGLPVEEEWLEPLGLLSLLVEALFIGLYLTREEAYVLGNTSISRGAGAPTVRKDHSSQREHTQSEPKGE